MRYFRLSWFFDRRLHRRAVLTLLLVGLSGLGGPTTGCTGLSGPDCSSPTSCDSNGDCCSGNCAPPNDWGIRTCARV